MRAFGRAWGDQTIDTLRSTIRFDIDAVLDGRKFAVVAFRTDIFDAKRNGSGSARDFGTGDGEIRLEVELMVFGLSLFERLFDLFIFRNLAVSFGGRDSVLGRRNLVFRVDFRVRLKIFVFLLYDRSSTLCIVVGCPGVCNIVIKFDPHFIFHRLQCRPERRGRPRAVGLAVLLSAGHVQYAEAIGCFTGVVWWHIIRSDGLTSIPGQRIGRGATDLLGDAVRDTYRTAVFGQSAIHRCGGGSVALHAQSDGLGLGQILGQWDVVFGLVGGGDGSHRQELIGYLVDHRAVIFPRVTNRARVEHIRFLVVRFMAGVNDWQRGIERRSLRVRLGVGCSDSYWRKGGSSSSSDASDDAGGNKSS